MTKLLIFSNRRSQYVWGVLKWWTKREQPSLETGTGHIPAWLKVVVWGSGITWGSKEQEAGFFISHLLIQFDFFFFKLNWAEWKTSPKSVLLSSSWELEMQRLEPSLEPTEWSVFHAMSWWLACPAIWGALVYQSWHGGLSGTQVSLAVMKVKKWGEGTHWTGEPTEGSCELSPPLYLPNLPQYSWLNRSLQILG